MARAGPRVLLAGDVLRDISKVDESSRIILGPGLKKESNKVVAIKCGILKKKGQNTYWIDNYQKRYIPVRGESVIGIVTAKTADVFVVDIGGSEHASLSYLAFEAANKRNRPIIQIGDVLYGKLLVASRDMEPELVCVDHHGKSSGMGVLPDGGLMFQTSINLVRKILSPSCNLCKTLGHYFKFEIVVGMNGRIWINAGSVRETIAVSNAVSLAETMTNDEITDMCAKLAIAVLDF